MDFYPTSLSARKFATEPAYQLDLSKFENSDTQVFAVSTDNTPSQKEFAAKLGVTFPLLSDFFDRKVSTTYGVLNTSRGIDNRVTFVIDKEGKIVYTEVGKTDTTGSSEACSRLAHRSTN
jgi:peroxiredoxin